MQSVRVGQWLEAAAKVQKEVDEVGLGQPRRALAIGNSNGRTILERFDETVTNESLRSASRKLLSDGHWARAVEEAFKCLNNAVKTKSGLDIKEGAALMRTVFSAKSPVLTLNEFCSRSDKDEQLGYMDIFAGAMTGIRNPRAHDHELDDHPEAALEMLVLASHLMRKLNDATFRSNAEATSERTE